MEGPGSAEQAAGEDPTGQSGGTMVGNIDTDRHVKLLWRMLREASFDGARQEDNMLNLTPVQAQWLTLAFVLPSRSWSIGYDVMAIRSLGSRRVDLAGAAAALRGLPDPGRRTGVLAGHPGRPHLAADGVNNRWS